MSMSREELARRLERGAREWTRLARVSQERVVVDPAQMGGVPFVRSVRVSVATIVRLVADEHATVDIVRAFPGLTREDVGAAVRFAADRLEPRGAR